VVRGERVGADPNQVSWWPLAPSMSTRACATASLSSTNSTGMLPSHSGDVAALVVSVPLVAPTEASSGELREVSRIRPYTSNDTNAQPDT
jgi:hypothetical protein